MMLQHGAEAEAVALLQSGTYIHSTSNPFARFFYSMSPALLPQEMPNFARQFSGS